ncbi:hypothetical protein HDV03_002181 [Kappamyces sp. JEL0829]|nr:hypothetical protein HDV03_002181 [Kappamyces sp. JEL0829]KAJ3371956.1 hypothetical protein HDU91_004730 [Kappamyces sp. JEL0680]
MGESPGTKKPRPASIITAKFTATSVVSRKPPNDTAAIEPPSRRPLGSSLLVRVLILRKILLLNDGRDKVLKCLQYGAKVLLWAVLLSKSPAQTRAKQLSSHFSLVRKVIRLGHFLEPLNDGLELCKEPGFDTLAQRLAPLNVVIGIVNDVSDDIICLCKMGVLDKPWLERCTPISDRLWYTSIFIDIHANLTDTLKLQEKTRLESDAAARKKLEDKVFMARVSLAKLLADYVFCTIDVFHLSVSDGWQAVSGLVAAVLGTYKLWIKHQ